MLSYIWTKISEECFQHLVESMPHDNTMITQYKINRGWGLPQQAQMQVVQKKKAPEKVVHITAGCKMLAGKVYMESHNQVAGIVYRNICVEYGLEVPGSKHC